CVQVLQFSSVWPLQLLSSPSPHESEPAACWVCWHTIEPPVQAVVPAPPMPARPDVQAPPPPGLPSSVWPLQSLSTLSQASAEGAVVGVHIIPPPEHDIVPSAHTPGMPVLHAPPPSTPSSTLPLQSSSTPLHDSTPGNTSPV